jgi:acylphosphatase
MKDTSKAVHVRIHGLVQGVGYRAWVERTAALLGLGGWVRNRSDGTVEAVFAGDPDAVEEMVRRCHEGPRAAVVDQVDLAGEISEGFQGFEVRPTV